MQNAKFYAVIAVVALAIVCFLAIVSSPTPGLAAPEQSTQSFSGFGK